MKRTHRILLVLSMMLLSVKAAFADIIPYPEPTPTPAPTPGDVPPTGDNHFALFLALAVVVIALVVVLRTIKGKKEK